MMTLEDLWYGIINSHEQFLDGNTKCRSLLPVMAISLLSFYILIGACIGEFVCFLYI